LVDDFESAIANLLQSDSSHSQRKLLKLFVAVRKEIVKHILCARSNNDNSLRL